MLIRPEHISIFAAGDGFEGRVVRSTFLAPLVRVEVEAAGVTLLSDSSADWVPAAGESVRVRLQEDALVVAGGAAQASAGGRQTV